MTLGVIVLFFTLHIILSVLTWLTGWVTQGDEGTGLAGALTGTPLGGLADDFSGGVDDINPGSAIQMALPAMITLFGLFAFKYAIIDGDGIAGMVGDALGILGGLFAAWVLYQAARSVAGALGFGR